MNETDYRAALDRVESLIIKDDNRGLLSDEEGQELDSLIPVIEAYESEHYPIDQPTDIEAIKFREDQEGGNSEN